MTIETIFGFWSYAHEDNRLDDGAILKLARLVEEEYNLLSGGQLDLFVDSNDIAWGDQWRTRIDSALIQTTFFIPIITPRYFDRPECRKELLEFSAKAKSLGIEELLLPILYVEPRDFSPENPDEAVALIARTQYVDWRTLRLEEPSSREYRKAVNALARRLLEASSAIEQIQFDRELSGARAGSLDGIAEIMKEVTQLLPDWLEAVMSDEINSAQITATMNQSTAQIDKLRRRNAPASAVLAARLRMGREMLPLLEAYQAAARTYLARSTQLDPSVSALARLVAEYPDSFELVVPLRDAIDEAMSNIRNSIERDADPRLRSVGDTFDETKHLGRIFQKCGAIFQDAQKIAHEGNAIVRRWDAELHANPVSTDIPSRSE